MFEIEGVVPGVYYALEAVTKVGVLRGRRGSVRVQSSSELVTITLLPIYGVELQFDVLSMS